MDKEKSKVINFCESCSYFEEGEWGENHSGRCPKCKKSWMWTIYECIYYKDGKVMDREAGLTDNDECDIHSDTLNRISRILNKGLKIIKNKQHKRQQV